jgi:Xaa-Pro aminopeptidase
MNHMPHKRFQSLTAEAGLDGIVALSPENFAYVSGAFISTVNLVRPRQAFAVTPSKGQPFLVICSIEKELAEEESWISDIRTYTEFADHPVDSLVNAMRDAGLDKGKIGIDLDYMPVTSYQRLTELLPNVTFSNTTEVIAAVRAIKTNEEVDKLEKITKQTHKAVLQGMAASRLGDTEADMARKIANNMINFGADGIKFVAFASGERTRLVHGTPSEQVVPKTGDVIRLDVGGSYGAWSSDLARTYSAGDPTAMQKRCYAALIEIEKTTINMIKPGVSAEDIFFFCRDEFEKRNIDFRMPHIGHSFGVELHENPMIRPGDKTLIQAGMVLNIEPMVRDDNGAVYHTEDLLVVTETGHRLLTLGLAPAEMPVIGQAIDQS